MEGGPRYFSGEMYEASHALADLADIKRRLRADLTDLTYVQVRLLMESIGKVRQVQGLYQSYSFFGSPEVPAPVPESSAFPQRPRESPPAVTE